MIVTSRIVWLLTGVVWAAHSLIGFADPNYWDPVTALDWSAVWVFSAALLLLAPSVLLLGRLASSRESMIAATVVASGAVVAGVANAVEDGLGVEAVGVLYVIGILTAGFALLWPLAVTLGKAGSSRLAMLSVALFVGVVLATLGGGVVVLCGLGAAAVAPRWFEQSRPEANPALGEGFSG